MYRETVIRVQFADGVILQGCFHPDEPVQAVYEWVSSCLNDTAAPLPFYLFAR